MEPNILIMIADDATYLDLSLVRWTECADAEY